MVDADEHRNASHDTGPLLFADVLFAELFVEVGIQKSDRGCNEKHKNFI